MRKLTTFTLVSTLTGVLTLTGITQAMSSAPSSFIIQTSQVHRNRDMQLAQGMTRQANNKANDKRVPIALAKVAANAEAVYDMAKVSNWTKATASLTSLKIAAKQLRKIDVETTQLYIVVAELNKAVVAKNRLAALREANQVTQIAANLTRQFDPKVPVEITLLDYNGRELEIWSEVGNIANLKATAGNLRQAWDSVRPSVENHGGKIQAKHFETLVTRVETAKLSSEYGRLATPILNATDKLEQLFN